MLYDNLPASPKKYGIKPTRKSFFQEGESAAVLFHGPAELREQVVATLVNNLTDCDKDYGLVRPTYLEKSLNAKVIRVMRDRKRFGRRIIDISISFAMGQIQITRSTYQQDIDKIIFYYWGTPFSITMFAFFCYRIANYYLTVLPPNSMQELHEIIDGNLQALLAIGLGLLIPSVLLFAVIFWLSHAFLLALGKVVAAYKSDDELQFSALDAKVSQAINEALLQAGVSDFSRQSTSSI